MSPGRLDLKVIGDRLELAVRLLGELRALPSDSLNTLLADRRNVPAAESLLRRTIEALFDTLRHILAKRHGFGGLEYRQVAKKAVEQGLVKNVELAGRLPDIAGFRNRLTHFYQEITAEELFGILRDHLGDLEALAEELRPLCEATDP